MQRDYTERPTFSKTTHVPGTAEFDWGKPLSLSIVIPCYNECESLRELTRRVVAVCDAHAGPTEVVLVNDGSSDGTWPLMLELAATESRLVCVNLSRNHGHQLALTAGLEFCSGQWVLILDADLQDPPELLPAMLEVARQQHADVVYGQRRRRNGEGALKRATAAIFYRLIERLTDTPIPRDAGDFRLISRRALDVLLAMPERHRFVRGMVAWIGFTQTPIHYDRDPRYAGQTKYPLRRMVHFAFDAIAAFSVKPLRLASFFGVGAAVVAAMLVLYSIYSWLFLKAVVGWTSIMATVAAFSSVQLFVLGILGEYLGRLYDQSKGRPLFIVERVVRGGSAATDDNRSVTGPRESFDA